jgi:hypothetical protein
MDDVANERKESRRERAVGASPAATAFFALSSISARGSPERAAVAAEEDALDADWTAEADAGAPEEDTVDTAGDAAGVSDATVVVTADVTSSER